MLPPPANPTTAAAADDVADDVAAAAQPDDAGAELLAELQRARRDAELALERISRLQALTSELSRALTALHVADVAVSECVGALGASAGLFVAISEDGSHLRILGAKDCLPTVLDKGRELPLDVHAPLPDCFKSGQPIFLRSRRELIARYPLLERYAARRPNVKAWALMPVNADDRALGVLGLSFEEARAFDEGERVFLRAIAQQCAQALERARLYEAERAAQAEAHANHQRFAFLAETSAALATTLEYETALRMLLDLAVPGLADHCAVLLAGEGRATRHELEVLADDALAAEAREIARRRPPRLDDPSHPLVRALHSGKPALLREVSDAWLAAMATSEEHLALLRRLAPRSAVVLPLLSREGTSGAIALMASEEGRWSDRDLPFVVDFAHRAALALEGAALYERAQQAIRARQDLLAIVSHDLRNPLGVILLNAAMLEKSAGADAVGDKVRQRSHSTRRAAERMQVLIGDLLDAASLESGRFTLEAAPEEPGALVRAAVDAMAANAEPKGISLVADVAPLSVRDGAGSGERTIACDRARVMQVFSNLVGNAIRFTPEHGTITLGVVVAGDHARFFVRDTGPGIPDEKLPHIFERYFTGSRATGQGNGLGLYIAQGIVEAHGGTITVETKPGAGCTFWFTLPRS